MYISVSVKKLEARYSASNQRFDSLKLSHRIVVMLIYYYNGYEIAYLKKDRPSEKI